MKAKDSDGGRRFLSRVDALLEVRLFDLALELAEERLERQPDDVDARIAMCKVWTRMGKLERVDEILQDVEKRIAEWSRLHAAMGDLCRDSGLKKEAVRFYRRFLELNPQGVPYATVFEKLDRLMDGGADKIPDKDMPDDEEHLRAVAPDFQTITLAELYLRQNQPDMARHVLTEILRRRPDHPEAAALLLAIDSPATAADHAAGPDRERVIRELSRWLDNIGRIRDHAA